MVAPFPSESSKWLLHGHDIWDLETWIGAKNDQKVSQHATVLVTTEMNMV